MTRPPPHVDLDAPLLRQVADLGDQYDAWVHRPVRRPGTLRIFQSPWLEALSHVPWWIVPVVWVPVIAILWALAARWQGLPMSHVAGLALAGLLSWTWVEYALHRWVFHFKPRTALGRRIHFLAHGIHHLDPWDASRLVMPPLAAGVIAVPVFLCMYGCCALLAPAAALGWALASFGGLLVGYIVYDMTHYFTHHVRPKSAWGKRRKAAHLAHHHKWPNRLYGVSQSFWDIAFRTGRPSGAPGARTADAPRQATG